MALVESDLSSEKVELMRPIYIAKCILLLKQVVLIVKVVLILSGLYSRTFLCVCLVTARKPDRQKA